MNRQISQAQHLGVILVLLLGVFFIQRAPALFDNGWCIHGGGDTSEGREALVVVADYGGIGGEQTSVFWAPAGMTQCRFTVIVDAVALSSGMVTITQTGDRDE